MQDVCIFAVLARCTDASPATPAACFLAASRKGYWHHRHHHHGGGAGIVTNRVLSRVSIVITLLGYSNGTFTKPASPSRQASKNRKRHESLGLSFLSKAKLGNA